VSRRCQATAETAVIGVNAATTSAVDCSRSFLKPIRREQSKPRLAARRSLATLEAPQEAPAILLSRKARREGQRVHASKTLVLRRRLQLLFERHVRDRRDDRAPWRAQEQSARLARGWLYTGRRRTCEAPEPIEVMREVAVDRQPDHPGGRPMLPCNLHSQRTNWPSDAPGSASAAPRRAPWPSFSLQAAPRGILGASIRRGW